MSNNFDVKSNEELFKQALVEGVNNHIDKTIEEEKKIEQIEEMTHEEVYQRYKEKKRQCKTVAQEVKLITSDPEMIMLIERLKRDNAERLKK